MRLFANLMNYVQDAPADFRLLCLWLWHSSTGTTNHSAMGTHTAREIHADTRYVCSALAKWFTAADH